MIPKTIAEFEDLHLRANFGVATSSPSKVAVITSFQNINENKIFNIFKFYSIL
jgi:hypothetical protein